MPCVVRDDLDRRRRYHRRVRADKRLMSKNFHQITIENVAEIEEVRRYRR